MMTEVLDYFIVVTDSPSALNKAVMSFLSAGKNWHLNGPYQAIRTESTERDGYVRHHYSWQQCLVQVPPQEVVIIGDVEATRRGVA